LQKQCPSKHLHPLALFQQEQLADWWGIFVQRQDGAMMPLYALYRVILDLITAGSCSSF
jgi:hypothetical protein